MSRLLDERGRILGKVNIVDVIVLLVIVAVVVFAAVRMTGGGSQAIPLDVQYTVEEVRQATVDALLKAVEQGAAVYDDGGTALGTIRSVTPHPTRKEVVTLDGELKASYSQVYSDVDIVVRGEATLSNSTYRINNVRIGVGKKVSLVGPGFEVQTVILHVGEPEE